MTPCGTGDKLWLGDAVEAIARMTIIPPESFSAVLLFRSSYLRYSSHPKFFQKMIESWDWAVAKAVAAAQVMLALCMRRRPPPPAKEMPEWEEVCAVACAVENLWLTATARGAAGALNLNLNLIETLRGRMRGAESVAHRHSARCGWCGKPKPNLNPPCRRTCLAPCIGSAYVLMRAQTEYSSGHSHRQCEVPKCHGRCRSVFPGQAQGRRVLTVWLLLHLPQAITPPHVFFVKGGDHGAEMGMHGRNLIIETCNTLQHFLSQLCNNNEALEGCRGVPAADG